jgi:hypothetical protein
LKNLDLGLEEIIVLLTAVIFVSTPLWLIFKANDYDRSTGASIAYENYQIYIKRNILIPKSCSSYFSYATIICTAKTEENVLLELDCYGGERYLKTGECRIRNRR